MPTDDQTSTDDMICTRSSTWVRGTCNSSRKYIHASRLLASDAPIIADCFVATDHFNDWDTDALGERDNRRHSVITQTKPQLAEYEYQPDSQCL